MISWGLIRHRSKLGRSHPDSIPGGSTARRVVVVGGPDGDAPSPRLITPNIGHVHPGSGRHLHSVRAVPRLKAVYRLYHRPLADRWRPLVSLKPFQSGFADFSASEFGRTLANFAEIYRTLPRYSELSRAFCPLHYLWKLLSQFSLPCAQKWW